MIIEPHLQNLVYIYQLCSEKELKLSKQPLSCFSSITEYSQMEPVTQAF